MLLGSTFRSPARVGVARKPVRGTWNELPRGPGHSSTGCDLKSFEFPTRNLSNSQRTTHSECHGETEEGQRRGGILGQAEVVTAVDGQPVVDCPDAADTRHDGDGISGPRLVQLLQVEAAQLRQRRGVVKPLPEHVKILHDLMLQRPLVAELIDIQLERTLVSSKSEIMLVTEPKRQGVVKEECG